MGVFLIENENTIQNKNEKMLCCTIGAEEMDLKSKEKEKNNVENKTIIIGKTKESKDNN